MYSAFSFGTILKTILPGSLFAAAVLVLCETIWFYQTQTSFLGIVAGKQLLTVAGAVFVPVSLILGFLLNTFVWLCLNSTVRRKVDANLRDTPFAGIRAALCERLQRDVTSRLGESHSRLHKVQWPSRIALEYYYLPVISVDCLTHLWESYFSWYEFDLNTLCALAFATPCIWLALVIRFPGDPLVTTALCGGVALTVALLCWMLWASAIRNMMAYERNVVMLIAGGIEASEKREVAKA